MRNKIFAIGLLLVFLFIVIYIGLTYHFALVSMNYYDRPVIKIVNLNEEDITDLRIEVRNNSIYIEKIPKGESRTVELVNPFGEDSIKLVYIFKGEMLERNVGYIESIGGYKVKITIDSNGLIDFNSGLGHWP
ncbi:MAG: hypothetical protein ABIA76_03535 [Candidatus Diapherotrites archaeon]